MFHDWEWGFRVGFDWFVKLSFQGGLGEVLDKFFERSYFFEMLFAEAFSLFEEGGCLFSEVFDCGGGISVVIVEMVEVLEFEGILPGV